MTAKGHLALAFLPGLIISVNFDNQTGYLFLSSVAIGSLFPDIDEPNSYISRKLKIFSESLKILGVGHRTITHYLIFSLFIASLSFLTDSLSLKIFILGFAFGILMHDVGDMLTKGGIKGFFYPFLREKTIRLLPKKIAFYTGSVIEYGVIFVLLIFDLYLYYIFYLKELLC